jgi:hypothetical protein
LRNNASTDIKYYGTLNYFSNSNNSLYGTFVAGSSTDADIMGL